jgi:hypothetical protein
VAAAQTFGQVRSVASWEGASPLGRLLYEHVFDSTTVEISPDVLQTGVCWLYSRADEPGSGERSSTEFVPAVLVGSGIGVSTCGSCRSGFLTEPVADLPVVRRSSELCPPGVHRVRACPVSINLVYISLELDQSTRVSIQSDPQLLAEPCSSSRRRPVCRAGGLHLLAAGVFVIDLDGCRQRSAFPFTGYEAVLFSEARWGPRRSR